MKPAATKRKDQIMRRRSSSRCSRKLMLPMCSERTCLAAAYAGLGIGRLRGRRAFRSRRLIAVGWQRLRFSIHNRAHRGLQDGCGGLRFLFAFGFELELAHFCFQLPLELVTGTLELAQSLPDLASDLRQLLGPKDDEGQQEDEDHLRHAKIHKAIILPWLLQRQ